MLLSFALSALASFELYLARLTMYNYMVQFHAQ